MLLQWLFIIYPVLALNIVLTSTDSWVSSNIRQLYNELIASNHTVVLAASLYHQQLDKAEAIVDGGDFNHLLPVHQTYFKNVDLINRPKSRSISKRNDEVESFKAVHTNDLGQDPRDPNIWYVNDHALNSLIKTIDVIIPQFYPEFKADLIIIGPNEFQDSHHRDFENPITNMINYGLSNNITTISITTQDIQHLYYQDENQFIGGGGKFKHNRLARRMRFINRRIKKIVKYLDYSTVKGLSINFPNLSHMNKCFGMRPIVSQIDSSMNFLNLNVDKFTWKDDKVVKSGTHSIVRDGINILNSNFNSIATTGQSLLVSPSWSAKSVLANCGISMEIVDKDGKNINKEDYNLEEELLLHPEPRFVRKSSWRRFFRLRYWKRLIKFYYYKLSN